MFIKPKTAAEDFSADMLPHTRRQVFFDVCKLHFGKLLLCGFIMLLFSLPLHFAALFSDLYGISVMEGFNAGEITAEEAYTALRLQAGASVAGILFYMLLGMGLSGLGRIIKRLGWEENVTVGEDFFLGVRQNAGQYTLLMFITGVIVLACSCVTNPIITGSDYFPGIAAVIICGIMLMPIGAFIVVTIPIYKLKFTQHIKYAFILYGSNFLKAAAASVLCFLPFTIQLIPNLWCVILGRLLSSVLSPFVMLGWFLFTYNLLDKAINKDNYPELVNKGLYICNTKNN